MNKQYPNGSKIIYDGANYCEVGPCPIVILSSDKRVVSISDPSKPENGSFAMTVEEYNNLLKNANLIGI